MIEYSNGIYYVTNDFGEVRGFPTKKHAISYLKFTRSYIPPTKQEIRKKKLERLKLLFK